MLFDTIQAALVVVAHPDDEVLGCGGTVARLAAEGKPVHVLLLGGVTTSRYKRAEKGDQVNKDACSSEADRAAAALGAASLRRFDFKDNRFDGVPLLDLIKAVEEVKAQVRPDLVLTHDCSDLNVDHRLTHQAVLTAFRPDSGRAAILTCETLSSTEWQDQAMAAFAPNLYVAIDGFVEKKIEAMRCYASELRAFPHPRSPEGIRCLAQKRGMEVCVPFAEAFRLVRAIV